MLTKREFFKIEEDISRQMVSVENLAQLVSEYLEPHEEAVINDSIVDYAKKRILDTLERKVEKLF